MNPSQDFDPLYGIPSNGKKIKTWTISVKTTTIDRDAVPTIIRTFGYVDGKQTTSHMPIPYGKNIGKKNETTPLEQAILQAQSMWNKQRASGYTNVYPNTTDVTSFLPMLAHDFKKRHKDITFPCIVQPKIDGVRMIAVKDGHSCSFVLKSRTGKHLHGFDYIVSELNTIWKHHDNVLIDGELFHKDIPFEQISGLSRTGGTHDIKLQYHIFDAVFNNDFNMGFDKRFKILSTKTVTSFLVLVDTITLSDSSQVDETLAYWTSIGFEGIMLRNTSSKYTSNYRSKDLQKLKLFCDDEFEIVSGKEADGEDKGTVIFQCIAENKRLFWVRPKGTRLYRKYLLDNIKQVIGKRLTVKFQNISEYGVPRFPVGIAIRDYE